MYEKPEIIMVVTKSELIDQIKEAKLDVSLYGCPSGKTYSDCHNG